jgi:acyl-CoA synthetase (NDP forming)
LPSATPVRAELAKLLPAFANVANPLDLTWAGLYDPEVARVCTRILGSHPEVGSLVLLQDAPKGLGPQQAGRYSRLLTAVAAGANDVGLPLVAVSNLSGEIHPDLAAAAGAAAVPYLRGTQEGFSALGRYARWAAGVPAPRLPSEADAAAELARAKLAALPGVRMPSEVEAREILAAYGIAGPRERVVASVDEAVAAAEALGFPVVLKAMVADTVHKTEAGLVEIGLRSADALAASAAAIIERARATGGAVLGLLVQEQVRPIAELLVGGRVDPDFGPLVVVGAGGVLVELYRDVAVRLAPIDESAALEALAETHVARLLEGFRGKPRGDAAAVARAVAAVSRFAARFADDLAEVEINPLAVMPDGEGCLALDAVIAPKRAERA